MSKKAKQKKLRRFLKIKELVMVSLAFLCLAGLVLQYYDRLSAHQMYILEMFEIIVGLAFLLEFGFEWYFAKNRMKYFKHHWVFFNCGYSGAKCAVGCASEYSDFTPVSVIENIRTFEVRAQYSALGGSCLQNTNYSSKMSKSMAL